MRLYGHLNRVYRLCPSVVNPPASGCVNDRLFRLEVLMFRVDRPWLQFLRRALFRGMQNRSMVPCQVHGGTILLPMYPGCATCHSHYCECLYCVGGPSAGWASECAGP